MEAFSAGVIRLGPHARGCCSRRSSASLFGCLCGALLFWFITLAVPIDSTHLFTRILMAEQEGNPKPLANEHRPSKDSFLVHLIGGAPESIPRAADELLGITHFDLKQERRKRRRVFLRTAFVVTVLGISIHNFPEGMALYLSSMKGLR